MRVGEYERWLEGSGEIRRHDDGFPAKQDEHLEQGIKQQGGKNEGANTGAPFNAPDGQSCADVACKHGDLPGGWGQPAW